MTIAFNNDYCPWCRNYIRGKPVHSCYDAYEVLESKIKTKVEAGQTEILGSFVKHLKAKYQIAVPEKAITDTLKKWQGSKRREPKCKTST